MGQYQERVAFLVNELFQAMQAGKGSQGNEEMPTGLMVAPGLIAAKKNMSWKPRSTRVSWLVRKSMRIPPATLWNPLSNHKKGDSPWAWTPAYFSGIGLPPTYLGMRKELGRYLTRIVHDQWIMRIISMTFLDKPVHTQKHPDFWFQIWSCSKPEYAEVYRGFGA